MFQCALSLGGVFIFPHGFVPVLGVSSLHGLACFPLLTMMSLFPADLPLSRTWSMVTQMAWETAKVSRPSSLLSFLFYSIPPPSSPPSLLSSLLALPSFPPKLSISLFAAVTFFPLPSVSSQQTSHFQRLLSICLFQLLSSCVPFPAVSLVSCMVNRVLCPIMDKYWFASCKFLHKHQHSAAQRKHLVCETPQACF